MSPLLQILGALMVLVVLPAGVFFGLIVWTEHRWYKRVRRVLNDDEWALWKDASGFTLKGYD